MATALKNAGHELYERHRPEQGLFYRIIETYWPIFVREQARVEKRFRFLSGMSSKNI
jgi:hypothetical protein